MAQNISAAPQAESNFAAELMLNRVMNGQMETSTGKVVNAATRNMATRHDATALSYDVLADNMQAAQAVVLTTQDALTELKNQVMKLQDLTLGAEDDTQVQYYANNIKDHFDAILATETNLMKDPRNRADPTSQDTPILVLGSTGKTITLGQNVPNASGITAANADTMVIGNADVRNANSKFESLYTAIQGGTIDTSNVQDLCSDAIDELIWKISTEGVKYNILSNRYDMYNDLASTYHDASDEQGVSTSNSNNVLLNTYF